MTVFGGIVILLSTITIPPKAVICELQPVTIQPKPSQENQPVETSFLDKVEIAKSDLSDEFDIKICRYKCQI
jgi:hypothetical protein